MSERRLVIWCSRQAVLRRRMDATLPPAIIRSPINASPHGAAAPVAGRAEAPGVPAGVPAGGVVVVGVGVGVGTGAIVTVRGALAVRPVSCPVTTTV